MDSAGLGQVPLVDCYEHSIKPLGLIKDLEFSCPDEILLAYQEGLC